MDVSTMFYMCRYCVFTLWDRVSYLNMLKPILSKEAKRLMHLHSGLMKLWHLRLSRFVWLHTVALTPQLEVLQNAKTTITQIKFRQIKDHLIVLRYFVKGWSCFKVIYFITYNFKKTYYLGARKDLWLGVYIEGALMSKSRNIATEI